MANPSAGGVTLEALAGALEADDRGVCRVPVTVGGRLLLPPAFSADALRTAGSAAGADGSPGADLAPRWFAVPGAQVLSVPLIDRATLRPTGDDQFLVLPDPDPRTLLVADPAVALRELADVPFRDVLAFVGALRDVLRGDSVFTARLAAWGKAASLQGDQAFDAVFRVLPELLDPEALAEAVDRQLGDRRAPGARYLDGWVAVDAPVHRGLTGRLAGRLTGPPAGGVAAAAPGPRLRAMPTRQLHITAGNSPVVPLVSLLWAFAAKGAAVVKSPAESTAALTLLACAMHAVDPQHPLTRHTSLLYWKGGDRRYEDILFAPGAFDRLVVWGAAATVGSVAGRAGATKTVFLNPRYGLSLIGRETFPDAVAAVALRAATDSLIANQGACSASLVHYVEGTEAQVLAYCRALQAALAAWDRALPHRPSPAALGRLRHLRRAAFMRGTWFENGTWPHTTSLVVSMPEAFDLAAHPQGRCVVVRRVADLQQALPYLHAGVSTVGVYPEARRLALRDALAARGVSNVLPLGEGERAYAGMPHDGMRVISELVNWTNA